MTGALEEGAKVASGFVTIMGAQPLALALVVMNLVLLGYLFYIGSATNTDRKSTVDLIVSWQKETDKLLANCVSGEVTRTMLDNMQKITETMLQAEQKEITRMQGAINEERNRSWELREREKKELEEFKKQQPQSAQPRAQNLKSTGLLDLPPLPPLPPERPKYEPSIPIANGGAK